MRKVQRGSTNAQTEHRKTAACKNALTHAYGCTWSHASLHQKYTAHTKLENLVVLLQQNLWKHPVQRRNPRSRDCDTTENAQPETSERLIRSSNVPNYLAQLPIWCGRTHARVGDCELPVGTNEQAVEGKDKNKIVSWCSPLTTRPRYAEIREGQQYVCAHSRLQRSTRATRMSVLNSNELVKLR